MKKTLLIMGATATLLTACKGTAPTAPVEGLIGRSNISIEQKRFTPEALWAMGRVGSPAVSPDGRQIAYTVAYYSVEANRSNREIFVMNIDGSEVRQLTQTTYQETEVQWSKDGAKLLFLSNESDSNQLYEMNPDGTGRRQLTDYDGDIEAYSFSPDGKKLLFVTQVKTVPSTADKHPDLPLSSGIIVDDLMYKHWDEWVTTAPHPFVADYNDGALSNIVDLLEGQPYESPMKPFGGIEQLAWSPDSKCVAYTCRKKTGKEYAVSTNSDIYEHNLATGEVKNLSEGNMGYDTNPRYSPDGRYLAWQSMERDGYEADLNRLMVLDLTTGEKRFVSHAFESNVDEFRWAADNTTLYFTGVWHGLSHLYTVDCAGNGLRRITDGQCDYVGLELTADQIITRRHSMQAADEIFSVSLSTGEATQLTHENRHIYDQVEMGRVEPRWVPTTDGKEMLVWVIYPPQFDPNKKYPAVLYCSGGPQSPVSQFWSYRWNFQVMAARDYILVAPNRRGMPGFGQAWNEQISGDYGGQCMDDYLSAIDAIAREPFVDNERLGCVGASFGGYSVYWLAGHHNKRFSAFIAHDGIFNMEMQYLETEEKWFANWDMGGAYWEKQNAVAQRTFANSPHRFVDRWDTPILCIHGEKDYRILPNHAMAAFDAAVLRGVPARLLIYPDENHWVLKPQNGVLWQRTFIDWLDRWLKPEVAKP